MGGSFSPIVLKYHLKGKAGGYSCYGGKMKKMKYYLLAGVCVGIALLMAWQSGKPTTLKIVSVARSGSYGNRAQLENYQQEINAYLEEKGKSYRVEFQLLIDSSPNMEEYANCDMLFGSMKWNLRELESYFTDLSSELTDGSLQPLYESMPKEYWKTLTANGCIYSTVRFLPVGRSGLEIDEEQLKRLGIEVPSDLVGKPLKEWSDFLAAVFVANQNKPFIESPYYLNIADEEISSVPYVLGNCWDAHFQMIAPFVGISYEEPEKGAQCIFESDYAKEMDRLWEEFAEKGYLQIYTTQELQSKFPADWKQVDNQTPIMRVNYCYSTKPYMPYMDEIYTVYPLEKEGHYAPNMLEHYFHQVLIPKESVNKDVTYQFMNDMSTDIELAQVVKGDMYEDGVNNLLTPTSTAQYQEPKANGPTEENIEKQKENYQSLLEPPLPGFAMDTEKVKKQMAAVRRLYKIKDNMIIGIFSMTKESCFSYGWAGHDEITDSFVQQMYDAGLQDIIDEANRQIEAYQK